VNPDVEALLERARNNIEAAQLLAHQGFPDIAASRSYYAMLYAVQALLLAEGLEFSSHGAVHAAFGQHFAKSGRIEPRFHRYVLDAFRARQGADYEVKPEVSAQDAATLIAEARELLAAVERLVPTDR